MEAIRLLEARERDERLPNDETRLCVPIRQSFDANNKQIEFAHAIMPDSSSSSVIIYTLLGLKVHAFEWDKTMLHYQEKIRIHAEDSTCAIARNGDSPSPGNHLVVINNTSDAADAQHFFSRATAMTLLCKDRTPTDGDFYKVDDVELVITNSHLRRIRIPNGDKKVQDLSATAPDVSLQKFETFYAEAKVGTKMMQIFDVAVFNGHVYCLCGTPTPGKRVCVGISFSKKSTESMEYQFSIAFVFDVKMDYADMFRIVGLSLPVITVIACRTRNPALRVIEYDTASVEVKRSYILYGNHRMTFPISRPLYNKKDEEKLMYFDRIVDVAAIHDGFIVALRDGGIFQISALFEDSPAIFPQFCGRLNCQWRYIEHGDFQYDTGFFHRSTDVNLCIGTWQSIELDFLRASVIKALDACKTPVVPIEYSYIGLGSTTHALKRGDVEAMISWLAYQENIQYGDMTVKQYIEAIYAADYHGLNTALLALRKKMFLQFRYKGISQKELSYLRSILQKDAFQSDEVFLALVAILTALNGTPLSDKDLLLISRKQSDEKVRHSHAQNEDEGRRLFSSMALKPLKMPLSLNDGVLLSKNICVVFIDCDRRYFKKKVAAYESDVTKADSVSEKMERIEKHIGKICAIVPRERINSVLRGLDFDAKRNWKLQEMDFGWVACSHMLSAESSNMAVSPLFSLFDPTCYVKPVSTDTETSEMSVQELTSAIMLFVWFGFKTLVQDNSLLGMQFRLAFGHYPLDLITRAALAVQNVADLVKEFLEGTKTVEEILPVYHLAILLHALSKMTSRFGAISPKKTPAGDLPVLDEQSQALVNVVANPSSLPGFAKCVDVLNSMTKYVRTTDSGSKRQRTRGTRSDIGQEN